MHEKCKSCLSVCNCCRHHHTDVCLYCKPFGSKHNIIERFCPKDGSEVFKFKFKIGDKVRIRKDLNQFHLYKMEFESTETTRVTADMYSIRGEIVTITDIIFDRYIIDKDYGRRCWADEMFDCKVV